MIRNNHESCINIIQAQYMRASIYRICLMTALQLVKYISLFFQVLNAITMPNEYVRELDRATIVSVSESEAFSQGSTNSESQPNPVNYDRTPERRRSLQECGDQPSHIPSANLLGTIRRNIRPTQESHGHDVVPVYYDRAPERRRSIQERREHDVLPVQESWREPTPIRRQATEN